MRRIRGVLRLRDVARPWGGAWPGAGLQLDLRLLWQTALVSLALSVGIGIVTGQQRLVAVPPTLGATHTHAGALGWIELGVVAAALALFGGALSSVERIAARVVSVSGVVGVGAFVLATLFAGPRSRAVFGAVALLSMVALLGWLGMRSPQVRFALPHLALLLSALALVLGTTIGALLEVQSASATIYFPGATPSAHPLVLAAGFDTLAAMAIVEWRLRPAPGRWPPLGVIQIAAAASGALTLCLAALLAAPALQPVAFFLELAAGVLFAARFAPRLRRVRWLAVGGERLFGLSALFLLGELAFLVYLLGKLSLHVYATFADIPASVATAGDHLLFLGVMTNALFGILWEATVERASVWHAADEALFWGMNLALLGFLAGLVVHNTAVAALLQGIFSPILGASLLVAVVAYSIRLQTSRMRGRSEAGAGAA